MKNIKREKIKNRERFQDLTEARALYDLIKFIHFLGNVCVKITGLLDKNKIFEVLNKEFIKSKDYTLSILLLTDDGSKLEIVSASLAPGKLKLGEKIAGTRLKGHKIDLNKSNIYSRVIRDEKIVQANVSDIIRELFSQPRAYLISKTMGYQDKNCILAPLYQGKKLIGVIAMSSTKLFEYFIPLVKNFLQHLSQTLELAEEIVEHRKAEKALGQSEQGLKNILASSPDAITITDLKGNIIECSQATLNLHGFSQKKELIGRSALDLIAKKDRKEALENMKKTLNQDFIKDVEYTLLTKEGRKFPAELSASVIRNSVGRPVAFMAITKNIFKRKQTDQAKNEFVSIASHQLRTPLSVLIWYSEMLLAGKIGKLNHQQGEYLEEIFNASQRLVKLMNVLLNLSRIESGSFGVKLEPVELSEFADNALNELFPQIKNKKIKVEKKYGKKPLIISADSNVIRIVFQNLLSNAVKYVPKGGKLKISIKKQKSQALISVSDNGYGIPKSQQAKIFSKFFRAKNIKEKDQDGTGLGLYIVKLVLEKSGGKIWFQSQENKGTAFYVAIPLKAGKTEP